MECGGREVSASVALETALTLTLSRAAGEGTQRHLIGPSPAAREREGPAAKPWEGEG
jgi:hypothetical protein